MRPLRALCALQDSVARASGETTESLESAPANLVPDSAEEPAVGRGEPANLVPEPAEEPHVRRSEPANLVPGPAEEPAVGPNLVPEPAEEPEPANIVPEPAEQPAVGPSKPAPEVGKSGGVIVCQFCGCPDDPLQRQCFL